ncbi:winged helix-turn-helix domain-containing protein [Candidatus Pelagibacter sp.]|nr:winged helix-turn-helix domain-containing protein [Candidatus Pelagibacter sp.]|tara:strand:- start:402 stop:971 length:570 start_codon:yes stop_codon:yes gene_type:complete
MNKQSVLIFKLPELFKILNELKDHLDFNIYNFNEKQELLNLNKNKYENYLILTDLQNQIENEKSQLILNKFPDTVYSIIEKINVNLLKQKYSKQSDVLIGKYSVDINSRKIKNTNESLKLTQREIQIILFLKESKSPQNISNLQKKVWGHNSNLETHTVETHIYRLRKKIFEKFRDNNFINSTKKGYII